MTTFIPHTLKKTHTKTLPLFAYETKQSGKYYLNDYNVVCGYSPECLIFITHGSVNSEFVCLRLD